MILSTICSYLIPYRPVNLAYGHILDYMGIIRSIWRFFRTLSYRLLHYRVDYFSLSIKKERLSALF